MNNVTIRPFDYNSDNDYIALETIEKALFPDEWDSAEEQKHDMAGSANYRRHHFLAEVDGTAIGSISSMEKFWTTSKDSFSIWTQVNPSYWGQGIGKALYQTVIKLLDDYSPQKFSIFTREDFPRAIRFLEDRNYELTMREARSILDVTTFDPTPFDGVAERVEAAGIRIHTFAELMESDPDCVQKAWAMRLPIRQDVPSTDEVKQIPFEVWQEQTLKSPSFNYEGYMIALDPSSNFIGVSYVKHSEGNPKRLWTELTGVFREWRRKSIATAMKLRIIEFARQNGITEIETDNEENNPMYQLNLRLGFKPEPAWLMYEKSV